MVKMKKILEKSVMAPDFIQANVDNFYNQWRLSSAQKGPSSGLATDSIHC